MLVWSSSQRSTSCGSSSSNVGAWSTGCLGLVQTAQQRLQISCTSSRSACLGPRSICHVCVHLRLSCLDLLVCTFLFGFLFLVVVNDLLNLSGNVGIFALVRLLHPEEILVIIAREAQIVDATYLN